jgi:hypothetical protein
MKEIAYNEIICRPYCSFYKEGKEEMECGGYQYLRNQLTLAELQHLVKQSNRYESISRRIPPKNEYLFNLVCKQCDFLIDGCDYSENGSGPPCGGYLLIEQLVNR